MNFKICPRLGFSLSIIFVLFTIVGTLSHEIGHYLTAKLLDFDASIHYDRVNWGGKNASSIQNFWISLGGPIQTMLTGTIGFVIILKRKFKNQLIEFNRFDWFLFFLSLFWLRQPFNLIVSLFLGLTNKRSSFYGGDEAYLSSSLGFAEGFLPILFGGIGLVICSYLIFRILPQKHRFTLILSGLIGGSFGFWFWVKILGPYLLPYSN